MSLIELFVDASFDNGMGCIGIYARKNGHLLAEIGKPIPEECRTNQEYEYHAIYEGLDMINNMLRNNEIAVGDNIIIYSDSQVAFNQIKNVSRANKENRVLCEKIVKFIEEIKIDITLKWIRSENIYHQQADKIARECRIDEGGG